MDNWPFFVEMQPCCAAACLQLGDVIATPSTVTKTNFFNMGAIEEVKADAGMLHFICRGAGMFHVKALTYAVMEIHG